jgi:hypothetical protein
MSELKTYGDLKKVINLIRLKQKGTKIGKVGVTALSAFIPGIEAAKTTYDLLQGAFRKSDDKKTDSWLDKLDIDDEVEAIVDDSVENRFLKDLANIFDSEPEDKELEDDFNMNQKLVDYLKKDYEGRTVTGIKENINMKTRFQQLAGIIEQEQQEPEVKVASPIRIIDKDLDDQKSNFKMVNTRDKMIQFLDAMVDNIKQANPDFVESSQFSQAVIAFYNKYK